MLGCMQGGDARFASISGKLSVPRLGRVFERDRLFTLLDDCSASPGLWMAAQPGAGKTTAAATWLRQRQTPTLWFELDADDLDPTTFALWFDRLFGAHLATPLDLPPLSGDDLGDLPGWIRRRLRSYSPQLPARWTLVLDNFQELPPASPLHAALAAALRELPEQARFVFISRLPPPAAYSLALARQQLAALDADQLRMDAAETLAMLRLHGRPETMAPALQRAQGWAAGMMLMLVGRSQGDALPGVEARERLFDLFASEVLAQMPPEQQRCLCLLAHLPSVTPDLALAITGNPDTASMLEPLAAASLFTDRREGPPTRWVFHALFSEFLRQRHARDAPPQQVQRLLRHAGVLLVEAGETDAGLQRLTEAQAWDDATACIRRVAPRYLVEGRAQALRRHMEALPAAFGEQLVYWRGCCVIDSEPMAALQDMQAHLTRCTAAGDVDGQLAAAAGAATVLVSTGQLNALDPWIDVISSHQARVRSLEGCGADAWLVPGVLAALINRRPWHPLLEALIDRGERLAHDDGAGGGRLLLGALVWHFLWRGQLDRLGRIVRRIDALSHQASTPPAALLRWWGVSVIIKTLLGRSREAESDAAKALALIDAEPSLASRRAFFEHQAMLVALGRCDQATARSHHDRAGTLLHPDQAVDCADHDFLGGMLALMEGDGPRALRLARGSMVTAFKSGWAIREHSALIMHALAAARCGEHADARAAVEQVFDHPMQAICRFHDWVGGCVAAFAGLQRGDAADAERWLRHGFGAARQCGFRSGPMLFACNDLMPRLAAFALDHDIEPEVARDLIRRHGLAAPAEAGESWPWPVRVRLLGALEVEIDGAPMRSSRKESRRLLDLLQLVAANSPAMLAIDRITDELWPDADGDAAANALDNLLHRLRKALGGEDRVLMRQRSLALNPRLCWVDAAEIEHLVARAADAAPAELDRLARRIRRLYRAPLAPDSRWPLLNTRRKALHRQAQRGLLQCAQGLDGAGRPAEATAAREPLPDLLP